MKIPGKPSADGGFTFIETLTCALAMTLVFGAVTPLVDGLLKSFNRLVKQEIQVYRIAHAYDLFSKACDQTCPPPWACPDTFLTKKSNQVEIHYIHGEISDSWSFEYDDVGIRIDALGTSVAFDAASADLATIMLENKIIGLALSFDAAGRTWSWRGYFGAQGI
jgi:hypothetical protein